jgi:quercetin dioxygenase-like cupin family protein
LKVPLALPIIAALIIKDHPMKRYRLSDLPDVREGHFLSGVLGGKYICKGAMTYKAPGQRTHTNDGPDGQDVHIHPDDCEVFIILQGRARMELNGERHPMTTGDIVIVEPGEDHHLISDEQDPCVAIWLHTGDARHAEQESST